MNFAPSLSRRETQRRLAAVFAAGRSDTAALDARLILCEALGMDHAALLSDPDRPIGAAAARLAELAARRSRHEPISRIRGRREFRGLDLAIGPAVLDPRPDTEIVVEAVLEAFAPRRADALRVLDLGTGSGAILGALLTELPNAFGVGVDISAPACLLARCNLTRLGLASRARILCGDWTDALAMTFDIIVSNPPYVARADIAALMPDVRDYDPRLALDGGEDGLAAYRAIVPGLRGLLAPDGLAALEVGAGQAKAVAGILAAFGLVGAAARRDLAGQERVLSVCLKPR